MTAYQQHLKLTELVKTERKITEEILNLIQIIDASKAYTELGYSSLFDYLTRGQKYSEGSAQRRISAARLIKELPEIKPEITAGKINLTQLSKLAIAVKQEQKSSGKKVLTAKKKEVVLRLKNKNTFETEKLLKEEFGYSSSPAEKVISKHEDVYLSLKLTKSQYEKLQKVQSYLSHSNYDAGFAEIIETLCDKLIQKKEGRSLKADRNNQEINQKEDLNNNPEISAQKQMTVMAMTNVEVTTAATAVKASTATMAVKTQPQLKTPRVFIPVATQRYILQKAQHCCEYQSPLTGEKCRSKYQLQLDHRVPLARGGGNHPENLRVLCRAHNLSESRRWGIDL